MPETTVATSTTNIDTTCNHHGSGLVGKKATYYSNSNLIRCIGQQPTVRYVRLLTGAFRCQLLHHTYNSDKCILQECNTMKEKKQTHEIMRVQQDTLQKTLKITTEYSILRIHSAVIQCPTSRTASNTAVQ
jgi:hypothetical protein